MNLIKSEVIERFEKHFTGLFTSYAAVLESDVPQIPMVIEGIKEHVLEQLMINHQKIIKKHEKAKGKYYFK